MKYNSIKEFLPAWIAALRSGKYKQGVKALRYEKNKFCCLGVAYDLLVEDGQGSWTQPKQENEPWCTENGSECNLHNTTLPFWFKGWVTGLFPGDFGFFSRQDRLIDMNDRERLSFNEIAEFLERERT